MILKSSRTRIALVVGAVAPAATCAAMVPFRGSLPNTDAALVLVLLVVAVACFGDRSGGLVGSVSAGVWFDFFLTKPYESLSIDSHEVVATTLLLFVIGVAVTELAVWGRRQHYRAGQQSGYLAGLHEAAEAAASGGSPTRLTGQVAEQLTGLLDLRSCRFHYGSGIGHPRLLHDGRLAWANDAWDIDRFGLPAGEETELVVTGASGFIGRFLMTPASGSQPDLGARLVAVALADQVGAAMSAYDRNRD